jgi:hypothetical protein
VIGPARANTLHVLLAIAWSPDVALSEPALNEAMFALRSTHGRFALDALCRRPSR